MFKLLKNFKAWMVLICSLIVILSQIPQTRDTAFAMAGIASAKEQRKTVKALEQQAEFNKLLLQIVLKDTLREQGMDSAAVDTFIKYLEMKWDSLLESEEK